MKQAIRLFLFFYLNKNLIFVITNRQYHYPNRDIKLISNIFLSKLIMKTIHLVVGIVLTLMCIFFMGFREIGRYPDKIWLDIKNLTLENRITALSSLNKLMEYFQIKKERLIIEGQNWKALEVFTQNGYYTSYYIPYDDPDNLSRKEQKCFIKGLQEIVDRKVVSALSFPGCWYTEIKESLNRSIDLLTWEHRSSQLQLLLSSVGREMLFDPQLKVILVKDKGKYHR